MMDNTELTSSYANIDEDDTSIHPYYRSTDGNTSPAPKIDNPILDKRANPLEKIFPCVSWLKKYDCKQNLLSDVLAGCAVGVMVIPQSMSYAKLAGLPVEYGLYSTLMPILAYLIWGSSRHLIVGPVALVSLILNSGLDQICDPVDEDGVVDEEKQSQYNMLAIQVGFLVGVLYLILGLSRLGFITIFLSHAVVSGFTTGAAVIIALSQLKYFFGYDVARSDLVHKIVYNLYRGIHNFNYKTFLMGILSVAVLVGMNRIGNMKPEWKWVKPTGPLLVTAITIIIATYVEKDLPIVGDIPNGLPGFTATYWIPFTDFWQLLKLAIAITAVGFMESIAIAKQLANKHKYLLNSNHEMVALGMANFFGSMFGSYPVTGSFSRSAVNSDAGATSSISGIATVLLVGLVLICLSPVFQLLPLTTLAAIVIAGVMGLVDIEEAKFLFKVHKLDFLVWCFSCIGTMFAGVMLGLGMAIELSLLFVIYELAYPKPAVLGRLPGRTHYGNIEQCTITSNINGILVVQIAAPMFFANVQFLREQLQEYMLRATTQAAASEQSQHKQHEDEMSNNQITKKQEQKIRKIKYMILDLSGVSSMDASAVRTLHAIHQDYADRGIQLCLCSANGNIKELLFLSGLANQIRTQYIFVDVHEAVETCSDELEMTYRPM